MKKTFLIGWKDVTLAFRDRAALILMLAAPFLLTLGLGFVTGRLSGSDASGVSDIPVVLVDQDGGSLGKQLVSVFQSPDLNSLVAPQVVTDPAQARQQVDQDRSAAAVIIPPDFSASLMAGSSGLTAPPQIELYTNPTRPTSVGVVQTILEEFLNRVEVGQAGAQVAVSQLVSNGLIGPQAAPQVGAAVGQQLAEGRSSLAIAVNGGAAGPAVNFDVLAYMAPGMALMFLMFTVSNGGRTLLSEQAQGTLPRLLVSPTSTRQILGGKVFGIFLTGTAQVLILILASTLLFQLQWGDPLAVLVLVLAAVAGAVGWGLVITALARTPGQVSTVGSAIMLIFGILGSGFLNLAAMPVWFQTLAKISPNAWGLDGFTTLAQGGSLANIWQPVVALLLMGGVLFSAAVVLINRRGFGPR
jgi:ABC-2 type transport system permease protein